MLCIVVVLVLAFLLVLATKAFKSKTVSCKFKIDFGLLKGFSLEFSTDVNKPANKKDAPTPKR